MKNSNPAWFETWGDWLETWGDWFETWGTWFDTTKAHISKSIKNLKESFNSQLIDNVHFSGSKSELIPWGL